MGLRLYFACVYLILIGHRFTHAHDVGMPEFHGSTSVNSELGGGNCPCIGYAEIRKEIEEQIEQRWELLEIASRGYTRLSSGYFYKLHNSKQNYYNAHQICQGEGGRLASTGLQHPFIRGEIMTKIFGLYNPEATWIGLDDLGRPNYWMWSDGARSFPSNTNWHPEAPNNPNNRCGEIRKEYSWHIINADCSKASLFLCEII